MKKLTLILLFVPILSTFAQNLSGTWGYKFDGHYITLYGDKIQNQNNGGSTGTLKVAIYATDYAYNGGRLSGYVLYEYKLDPLDAGYSFNNISKTGWCTFPPTNNYSRGSYSLSIILLEYSNRDYEIVDYITIGRESF